MFSCCGRLCRRSRDPAADAGRAVWYPRSSRSTDRTERVCGVCGGGGVREPRIRWKLESIFVVSRLLRSVGLLGPQQSPLQLQPPGTIRH